MFNDILMIGLVRCVGLGLDMNSAISLYRDRWILNVRNETESLALLSRRLHRLEPTAVHIQNIKTNR